MAFHTVLSASIQGLHVEMVHVEADVSNGLPMFHMVGYLSAEVKEASERVRTAIRNAGIQIPARKVVVNLAPATVRKKGASFDLPIALAVMAALGEIEGGGAGAYAGNRGTGPGWKGSGGSRHPSNCAGSQEGRMSHLHPSDTQCTGRSAGGRDQDLRGQAFERSL